MHPLRHDTNIIFFCSVKIGQHTVLVRDRADAVNQQENNVPFDLVPICLSFECRGLGRC